MHNDIENEIQKFVALWEDDARPLEFEQFLNTLDNPMASAILEHMKKQTEEII